MEKLFGIYVGRLCPIHLGHEALVNRMIEMCGFENSLLVLGSSNNSFSLRHFFCYEERRKLIKTLFPNLSVVGLPDYPTDQEWLVALDDILRLANPNSLPQVFFGGCEEDVQCFLESRYKVEVVNRFDGSTPKISATEVRDALIHGRKLDNLLNPKIQEEIKKTFSVKWERFKKI